MFKHFALAWIVLLGWGAFTCAHAAIPETGYDSSWYISNFWSGEYPPGFSVIESGTIVKAREKMDKDAPQNVRCELPYRAVIHPWNNERIKKSQIEFLSATKIVPLIAKQDFVFEGFLAKDSIKIPIKKGDIIKYIRNDSEGSFEVQITGKEYTGDQNLFDHVQDVAANQFKEEDWMRLNCENGKRAYIFLDEIISENDDHSDRYAPGTTGVGPGQTEYGKARDLSDSEVRQLKTSNSNNVAEAPAPSAPVLSTALALKMCSATINDPLRQMIIDMIVFSGKHLGQSLNSFKSDLDNDYGSFLTVHDDATVERVDEHTGKVGCAVTYDVDLKGLASKVLDEGATTRAQMLIRQMSEEGKSVTKRLSYTVQQTSGDSLMVWFGLQSQSSASAPRRRTVRCVFVLNGRCVVFRR